MKTIIIIFSLFALIEGAYGQTIKKQIEIKSKNPNDLVSFDEIVFENYFDDLNNDGKEDCVIITKQTKKELMSVKNQFDNKVDRNRRGILIAFKDSAEYFNTVLAIPDCFSSENEDGGVYFPPDLGAIIDRGNLIIRYGHGRYGWWQYVFRYRNNNFELIGYDQSNNRGPVTESSININFLTKKKQTLTNTNLYAETDEEEYEEVFEETWQDIIINNRLILTDIKYFDDFDVNSCYIIKE